MTPKTPSSAAFTFRPRLAVAIVLVAAFFVVPAIAVAGKTTRTDLLGSTGYCQSFDPSGGAAVGKAQITAPTATSPGFHPVRVDLSIRGNQLQPGDYPVWLVSIYRDDTGQVIGCSASGLANTLTVKSGAPVSFHGSADRYTGHYELQVYVGPIFGPGYGSAPVAVDVG